MAVTEPVPYAIAPSISVSSERLDETFYFRQITRGNLVLGGCGHEPVDLDKRRAYVRPKHTLRQLTQMTRVVPALGHLQIIRVWSGIEGYMEDDRPVMGPSARVPGLYYAFGFSGAGFQLGPGVGDVMAELIHTGATTTPIEAFHIARFSRRAETTAA